MSSSRMDRINQLFKREIGNMLQFQEVKDPRLLNVSITYVNVSPDLANARVGFSVLTDDEGVVEKAEQALRKASGYIRKLLSKRVVLRHYPELRFVYDRSIRGGIEMDQLLDQISQERQQKENHEETT